MENIKRAQDSYKRMAAVASGDYAASMGAPGKRSTFEEAMLAVPLPTVPEAAPVVATTEPAPAAAQPAAPPAPLSSARSYREACNMIATREVAQTGRVAASANGMLVTGGSASALSDSLGAIPTLKQTIPGGHGLKEWDPELWEMVMSTRVNGGVVTCMGQMADRLRTHVTRGSEYMQGMRF